MRRRLGLICVLATFAGMLTWSGCSDYDEIKKISFEDVNPEMIMPIAHGQVSMEEIIKRSGEEEGDTELVFHDDTVFLRFQYKRSNPELGFLYNVPIVSETSTELTFGTTGNLTKGNVNLKFPWPMVSWLILQSAEITSSTATLFITATSDDSALTGKSISFEGIADKKMPTAGTLALPNIPINNPTPVKVAAKQITSGGTYKFELASPLTPGNYDSKLPLDLKKPALPGVAGTVKLKFKLVVSRYTVAEDTVSGYPMVPPGKINLDGTWNVKLFNKEDGPNYVDQKIEGSRLVLEVQKFKAVGWTFSVDQITANSARGSKQITNRSTDSPEGYEAFRIHQENQVPSDSDNVKFILNDQNSNIKDVVESGAYDVTFENFTFTTPAPNVGAKVPKIQVGDKGVSLGIYYEVPFAGQVTRDGIDKKVEVGENAFPSAESITKYVKNNGKAKDVILHLRFINHMPIAIGMNVKFASKDGQWSRSLDSIAKVSPDKLVGATSSLPGYSQWIAPAQVDDHGVASGSATSDVFIPLSIEQYKEIAEKTRSLDLNIVMATPDAVKDKKIKLSKTDWLKIQLGVEFTANYEGLLGSKKEKK